MPDWAGPAPRALGVQGGGAGTLPAKLGPMTRFGTLPLLAAALLAGCPGPEPVDTTWTPAFDAAGEGWLMNVWGPAEDDIYAVGGAIDDGNIMHFDGETWTRMSHPETPLLNWVFGFGADDLHVVGNDGTILHWDGSSWSAVESPTDQDLWGVWGAAPDDVWAVGGTARRPGGVPTVIHYDGTTWSGAETPTPMRENVFAFFKVWGSSASDVYVVGDAGIVLHWDGAAWEELFVGAMDDLVAVWGLGPDFVVAVGGRGNGIVSFFDGEDWRSEFVSPLPGLNGVWMRSPDEVHVVGNRGTLAVFDPATFTFEEPPVTTTLDYHAIHGNGSTLYAVGGNLAFPSGPMGVAFRRDLEENE